MSSCDDSHKYLVSGTCPWCGWILPQCPTIATNQAGTEKTNWNISAVVEDIERDAHANSETPIRILAQIALGGFELEAVPLLQRVLANSRPTSSLKRVAIIALRQVGERLSQDQFEQYERTLEKDQGNVAVRVLLIGYCSLKGSILESLQKKTGEHVLWIAQNAPDLAALLGPALLVEAAICCGNESSPEISLLLQESDEQTFCRLREEFDRTEDPIKRHMMLPQLARAAFDAGAWDQAEAYALAATKEPLRLTREPELDLKLKEFFGKFLGDGIHVGNIVLGRLALKSGDVAGAKRHLLAAGTTPGSPVLCSFGPDMTLARGLLQVGERETVKEYLKLCASFWHTTDHRPDKWIHILDTGGIPDFE